MPLISLPRTQIIVDLTDRVFNDTVIKQEAVFIGLRHDQNPETSGGTVNVTVLVRSYSSDNGAKGISMNAKGMPDKRMDLVADNNTVVNPADGTILAINPSPYETPEWRGILAALEVDYAFQGDFFIALRESSPIVIGDLIRQHILAADAMGKFA